MRESVNKPPEIPEHELVRQIGRGAYGDVWIARNTLGTFRAVKIVYRNQFDHARPYERELNAIRAVEPLTRRHDSLVDILQVGEREDCFYYIMELADDISGKGATDEKSYKARTLRYELDERGKLPVEATLKTGISIARALGFLHQNDLVHRDVKPANIIYVDGKAKLADIGLVVQTDSSISWVGTHGYIPREGPGRAPADVFALGKVLYELATGKDRADFPEVDVLDRSLKGLNQIYLKACEEDATERFPDGNTLAMKLEELVGEPDRAGAGNYSSWSNLKASALVIALVVILVLVLNQNLGKNTDAENPGEKGKRSQNPHPNEKEEMKKKIPAINTSRWDFSHEYKTVLDPSVYQFLQGKENAKIYLEEESGACYWALEAGGQPASLTYRYTFGRKIERASLTATLETYNFGPRGFGHSSIWVSKDGDKWVRVLDGPAPMLPPGRTALGANFQINKSLPREVLGGEAIWVQARMESPNSEFGPIFGQFSRAGKSHEGKIYAINFQLAEKQHKPLVVDRDTILLEHFEGATTGRSNRPIAFGPGRYGQGMLVTPHTSVSWDKGPLSEGTFEFWFNLDEEYGGTLASANYSNLPAAITIMVRSTKEGALYAELFSEEGWQRPNFEDNKIKLKQWNHAAISWGRAGILVYLNGKTVGQLFGSHALSRNTGTWVVGSQIRSNGGGFAGMIDEVRISGTQRRFFPSDFNSKNPKKSSIHVRIGLPWANP